MLNPQNTNPKSANIKSSNIKSPLKIRKKTAIAHILVVITLLLSGCFGYKESIWLLWFICFAATPFVVWNAYKYFFNLGFRKNLNEYHDNQKALPKEERDINRPVYSSTIIFFVTTLFFITILTGIILKFFNLL